MIKTRKDLDLFLDRDRNRNGSPSIIRWLTWNDNNRIQRLLNYLRHTEYYSNNRNALNIIPYLWYKWNLRRMIVKSDIMVFPHCIGPGVQFMHPGFRRIGRFVKIG